VARPHLRDPPITAGRQPPGRESGQQPGPDQARLPRARLPDDGEESLALQDAEEAIDVLLAPEEDPASWRANERRPG